MQQDWPEGWGGLAEGQAAAYLAQLARELGPDHALAGAIREGRVRAIGVADGSDDVVYALTGERAPFIVVHLAWPGPDRRFGLVRWLRPYPHRPPAVIAVESRSDLGGEGGAHQAGARDFLASSRIRFASDPCRRAMSS